MRLPATGDASAISPPCRFEAALVGQTENCSLPLTRVKGASSRVVGRVPGMTGQWYSVGSAIRPTAGLGHGPIYYRWDRMAGEGSTAVTQKAHWYPRLPPCGPRKSRAVMCKRQCSGGTR